MAEAGPDFGGSSNNGNDHGLNSAKTSTSRMQSFKDTLSLLRSPSPAHPMNESSQGQARHLKPPHSDDMTTSNPSSEDGDSFRHKKNQKKRLVEDNREFRDWKEREQYIRRQYKCDDVPEARNSQSAMAEAESDEIVTSSSQQRMSGAYTGKRLKSQSDNSTSKKLRDFVNQIWGKSKAVTSSVISRPKKEKKLKDVKTRRDTPYPMPIPARPVISPTIQGLPPTPSKITLRKPSEPNGRLDATFSIPEERVADDKGVSASKSVSFKSMTSPTYSVSSSLLPLPPTPDRIFGDSTTASVDQNIDDGSDKYTTPPAEPQTLNQAKRISLARSLSDNSPVGTRRSSSRRTTSGSENVMTIRNATHESLWKNRSSLLITSSSLLDAKTGVSEHYSQHPLPMFATAPFSLLNPHRAKEDTPSQSKHYNSALEEGQTKDIDQLDGSRGSTVPVFDDKQVDTTSLMIKFDGKVEKVSLSRAYLTHSQTGVDKRNDDLDRDGDVDSCNSGQSTPRPPLYSRHTAPPRSIYPSQVSLGREMMSKSHRLQKNTYLLSLPLHKYLELALSLGNNERDTIPMPRRTQSVPEDIGSTIDQSFTDFSSTTSTQEAFSPSEEEEKLILNTDGHISSEQLSTIPIRSRINNRAFDFTMLRNTFVTRSG